MSQIKCACQDPKCQVTLQFIDGNLTITDAAGKLQLVFLNSDSIKSIVFEAKQALLEKVFGKQEEGVL